MENIDAEIEVIEEVVKYQLLYSYPGSTDIFALGSLYNSKEEAVKNLPTGISKIFVAKFVIPIDLLKN